MHRRPDVHRDLDRVVLGEVPRVDGSGDACDVGVERQRRPRQSGIGREEVGDGPGEHHLVLGRVGERPRAIRLARGVQHFHRAESVGGGLERGVELLEPVDEDRVDESVLAAEVRVHAGRRAAGGGGDVADRERARTFALHDPDRGAQDRGALIGG